MTEDAVTYMLMFISDDSNWDPSKPEIRRPTSGSASGSTTGSAARSPAARSSRGRTRPRRCVSATGKITVTDGPFTEAKESIGGYALLDAKNLHEAIAMAKRCATPSASRIRLFVGTPGGALGAEALELIRPLVSSETMAGLSPPDTRPPVRASRQLLME
jgi:hypothetical protein